MHHTDFKKPRVSLTMVFLTENKMYKDPSHQHKTSKSDLKQFITLAWPSPQGDKKVMHSVLK